MLIVELTNDNEHARRDVEEENQDYQEEHHTLYSRTNLECSCKLTQNRVSALKYLCNFDKSCHSNQLIELSNLGESYDGIHVRLCRCYEVKWEYG